MTQKAYDEFEAKLKAAREEFTAAHDEFTAKLLGFRYRGMILMHDLRGRLTTEMLRLPAPDPLKDTLQEIDNLASKLESEIGGLAL